MCVCCFLLLLIGRTVARLTAKLSFPFSVCCSLIKCAKVRLKIFLFLCARTNKQTSSLLVVFCFILGFNYRRDAQQTQIKGGTVFFSSFIDAFKTLSPSCYLISCCSIYFLIHIKKIVFIFWCGEREDSCTLSSITF